MFISFEGIDGSGKSTQIELLTSWFQGQGKTVSVLREPGATPLSEAVRSVLLTSTFDIEPMAELLLFCASRRQLVENVIRPSLEQGTIVLCDRYADSSVAYQGYGRGLPLGDVHTANTLATGNLFPDITFFIDIPVDESLRRARTRNSTSYDRMERAGVEFFERVRRGYNTIAEQESRFYVLDGTLSVQELHHQIVGICGRG